VNSVVNPRRLTILLCLALLISAVTKIQGVGSRELWLDEAYSAYVAGLPFSHLLQHSIGDVHPPLYYAMLWLWVRFAGNAKPLCDPPLS
jgi:hypothetical protein